MFLRQVRCRCIIKTGYQIVCLLCPVCIFFSWTTNYCLDWGRGNASKIIDKNIQKKTRLSFSFFFCISTHIFFCSLDFGSILILSYPSLHTVSEYTIGILWIRDLNSTEIFVAFTQEIIREALIRKIFKISEFFSQTINHHNNTHPHTKTRGICWNLNTFQKHKNYSLFDGKLLENRQNFLCFFPEIFQRMTKYLRDLALEIEPLHQNKQPLVLKRNG